MTTETLLSSLLYKTPLETFVGRGHHIKRKECIVNDENDENY